MLPELPERRLTEIRLEELYRIEVQRKLHADNPSRSRWERWNLVLSSPFILWLLSAVVLAGAGAAFTQHKEELAKQAERQEMVEKLDLEISYRYSQILVSLERLGHVHISHNPLWYDVKSIVSSVNSVPESSLYPEFSGLALPALLAELRRHLKSKRERDEIDAVLAELTSREIENLDYEDIEGFGKFVQTHFLAPRWKVKSFRYVNCSPREPFC
jgi:hypothetical protein